ncbi:hypothetical protein BJ165DRAFT_1031118 [Panaeolus papilionaceus]|nr:hypothetical protein BJ165DRAFT_1031118 [Panaeolus papilionaceus]
MGRDYVGILKGYPISGPLNYSLGPSVLSLYIPYKYGRLNEKGSEAEADRHELTLCVLSRSRERPCAMHLFFCFENIKNIQRPCNSHHFTAISACVVKLSSLEAPVNGYVHLLDSDEEILFRVSMATYRKIEGYSVMTLALRLSHRLLFPVCSTSSYVLEARVNFVHLIVACYQPIS